MKQLTLSKILAIVILVSVAISCNESQEEITVTAEPTQPVEAIENHDLATFNFANGNTLKLIVIYQEGEPVVGSVQMGKIENLQPVDYRKNSMLDVYLALTPDHYPIPKLLADLAPMDRQARLSAKRQVIEESSEPIELTIEKLPVELTKMQGSFNISNNARSSSQRYCDGIKNTDFCTNAYCGPYTWTSSSLAHNHQVHTYVFPDSQHSMYMEVWAKPFLKPWLKIWTSEEIKPGFAKLFTVGPASYATKRRSKRLVYGGTGQWPWPDWRGYDAVWWGKDDDDGDAPY